jgi:hypothetical protein
VTTSELDRAVAEVLGADAVLRTEQAQVVDALRERDTVLVARSGAGAQRRVLEQAVSGDVDVLLLAPEQLSRAPVIEALDGADGERGYTTLALELLEGRSSPLRRAG